MRRRPWVIFGVALGMIAATAGWLTELSGRVKLGAPGVLVEPKALYDSEGRLASPRGVVLPTNMPGFASEAVTIGPVELTSLPEDTTFGRRLYRDGDFCVQLGVVLMGRDHTSIHQPQYCLFGQGWTVTNTERIELHMEHPCAYDIPAIKLNATQTLTNGQVVNCLYVYWFVSKDKITAEEGARLWSQWKGVLEKGMTERWAYISYFVACQPGAEAVTFQRLEKFIELSVPEFQIVTGGRTARTEAGDAGG